MGTVAKSTITLTSISDGYSLSLSPSSCVIHADYDGSNPVLTNAKTTINVYCGDTKVPIAMGEVSTSDIANISASCRLKDSYTLELAVLKLSTAVLEGYVSVDVIVSDYLTINAKFQFTVERETTMLDWILDWENGKTTIGDSYVITPKIFVGKKITGDHSSLSEVDGLTGVYIGPSDNDSCGVYGYNAGVEIFHLDETGGSIGGWDINSNGLVTENSNGRVGIYSDGTVAFYNTEGDAVWKLDGNGNALFAMGNVTFDANGNARFAGEILSSEGTIGGWVIEENGLYNSSIVLNSKNKYIAVINTIENLQGDYTLIKSVGGCAMYYTSNKAFGFLAYSGGNSKVFAAGSENYIAGWSFDENAIWLGTKNNNTNEYTANASSITLGTKGLRGCSWYINVDGTASFVKGWVTFSATEGKIAGWTLDKNSLWNGTKNDTLGEFTSASGSITIGSTGIRGYKWYLDTDGKASFAGGKVFFQTDGSGYVANQNLIWDASGAVIVCGGNVKFNTDGSGYVAAENISWDKDGNIKLSENITALWGDGVSVAQKMALSTVLYRDTEFADGWNGLNIYLENNWVDVSCQNAFAYTLTSKGLYMLGYATILQVNLVATDGTVTKLWSGNQWAGGTPVMITDSSSFQNLDTSSTLRIYFSGLKNEGCKVAIAHITATGDDGSIEDYDTFQLYGYDSNVGKTTIGTKVTRTDDSTAPNSSQKILSIVDNFWHKNGDWRLGGVHFANQTRANGEFIVRIVALIPENWMIDNYHNAYGGGTTTWVTSQKGTGKWADYVCLVKCGASGIFSTINHFALKLDPDGEYAVESMANTDDNLAISVKYKSGDDGFTFANVTWKIAFATVYDATSSDKTLTTIDKNGIYTGTLRADQIIAGTIDATKIDADTILSNGSAWALNKDGSGYLANGKIAWDENGIGKLAGGNISWTANGDLTLNGEITATGGKIGGFTIGSDYLYYGNASSWSSLTENTAVIGPNFIRIGQSIGYFNKGDIATQVIGIGAGSDPTVSSSSKDWCSSAMYIYRKMNDYEDIYKPAVKIVSDNVINRDIGLRVVGGVQVQGGLIEVGRVMLYDGDKNITNVIDLSFGTTIILLNTSSGKPNFYLPTITELRKQVGITDTTQSFCVPVRVICGKTSNNCYISSQAVASGGSTAIGGVFTDNNANDWAGNNKEMGQGDVIDFVLTYTSTTGYYMQLVNIRN